MRNIIVRNDRASAVILPQLGRFPEVTLVPGLNKLPDGYVQQFEDHSGIRELFELRPPILVLIGPDEEIGPPEEGE